MNFLLLLFGFVCIATLISHSTKLFITKKASFTSIVKICSVERKKEQGREGGWRKLDVKRRGRVGEVISWEVSLP